MDNNTKGPIWGSRCVDIFSKLEQIGEGTYGKVFMARNNETNEIVALKKVRMDNEKEGFPITAIREIKILKRLHHENIVQLKEIVTSKAMKDKKGKWSIYMVFEYMDHDLTGLMMNTDISTWNPEPSHIKCYMKQLLQGLYFCHKNNVLHRDIKGSNLLINNEGKLKLADFGLARPFSDQSAKYTNRVITLWYRPPEILLGTQQYGPAVDIWSAGCIMAELILRKPLFPGKNEIDQLDLIYRVCGTPNSEQWPDIEKMPNWHTCKPTTNYRRCIRETFSAFPKETVDLLDGMLTLDPNKRINAEAALESDYFWIEPLACDPKDLPKHASCHEFQAKKRRQQLQTNHMDPSKRLRASLEPPIANNPTGTFSTGSLPASGITGRYYPSSQSTSQPSQTRPGYYQQQQQQPAPMVHQQYPYQRYQHLPSSSYQQSQRGVPQRPQYYYQQQHQQQPPPPLPPALQAQQQQQQQQINRSVRSSQQIPTTQQQQQQSHSSMEPPPPPPSSSLTNRYPTSSMPPSLQKQQQQQQKYLYHKHSHYQPLPPPPPPPPPPPITTTTNTNTTTAITAIVEKQSSDSIATSSIVRNRPAYHHSQIVPSGKHYRQQPQPPPAPPPPPLPLQSHHHRPHHHQRQQDQHQQRSVRNESSSFPMQPPSASSLSSSSSTTGYASCSSTQLSHSSTGSMDKPFPPRSNQS